MQVTLIVKSAHNPTISHRGAQSEAQEATRTSFAVEISLTIAAAFGFTNTDKDGQVYMKYLF